MPYFAVDVGSSFIKTAWLDLDEAVVLSGEKMRTPPFLPADVHGIREISVDAVAALVRAAIERAAAQRPIQGVVFSTQMHGMALSRPTGVPVGQFVTWQDERACATGADGLSAIAYVRQARFADMLRETGAQPGASHTVCQLAAMRRAGLEGPLCLSLLGDALIARLCGHPVPMHVTNAQSTGLYHLAGKAWHKALIDALGLGDLRLPPLADGRQPVGWMRTPGGKVPLYAAVGDQQAAVLGAMPARAELLLNIATGAQLVCLDDAPHTGLYELRPFFEGQYFRTVTHIPAGRMLDVLIDCLADIGVRVFDAADVDRPALWERVTQAVEAVPGTSLTMDTAFFPGHARQQAGNILGITADTFRFDQIVYAALRDMARRFAQAYEQIRQPGDHLRGVLCTGGIAQRTPLLLTMIADAFQLPCRLSPYEDDVLTGLLRLGLWVSGRCDTLADTDRLIRPAQP